MIDKKYDEKNKEFDIKFEEAFEKISLQLQDMFNNFNETIDEIN